MTFPWIKRPDLIAAPHDTGGWVVKDPLTLQYALLNDLEYRLLNLLDGRTGFPELLRQAQGLAPAAALTAEDLADFIRGLAGHQLIRQHGGGDSIRLNPDAPRSPLAFISPVFQVLRIQMRLWNPSRWIDAMLPVVAFLFHRNVVRIACATGLIALSMVTLKTGEIVRAMPTMQEFLGPQNILLMLSIFVTVKILHELGHAITAKYFGAECNECGVMLMVFTPVLYTNVSDSWLLPRNQRMLVTAAGIFVELFIASVCTILWWNAEPGLTRSILLNTMILCSVNTILFNGNPLLRFDGYFLLADYFGIPNLASESTGRLREVFVSLITGRHVDSQQRSPRSRFLLVYGILAAAYRVFLTVAILKLVQEMARQWHVQFLGTCLSLTIISAFIFLPLLSLVGEMRQQNTGQPFRRSTWTRVAACCLILVTLLLLPLPQSVVAPAFVQPTAPAVFATLSGRLNDAVPYGTSVNAGTKLAELTNAELTRTRQNLEAQYRLLDEELKTLENNPVTANSELIPSLKKSVDAAEQRLQQFDLEFAKLHIDSPSTGTFFPPPVTPRQDRSDLPEFWHGTPIDSSNVGAWIERGTLLGYIGEASDAQLLVAVSEDDVDFVIVGQAVKFLTGDGNFNEVAGKVTSVSQVEAESVPLPLSAAGLMSGRVVGNSLQPSEVTYIATVAMDKTSNVTPAFYSTGKVRIRVASSSIGDRIVRYFRQAF